MARWSQNRDEARHLVRIQQELKRELAKAPYNIFKVLRKDDNCLEGYISDVRAGNNSHIVKPPTSFYGEVTLQFPNGYTIAIDLLDVEKISNVTNSKNSKEYYKAGIFQAGLPKQR